MDPKEHSSRARGFVLAGLVLLPMVYVGLYFAVLALPGTVRVPSFLAARPTGIHISYIEINGQWSRDPDYHGLPDWLFMPIHDYDRKHLRPGMWSGSHPRNEELSFDWLVGRSSTRTEGK